MSQAQTSNQQCAYRNCQEAPWSNGLCLYHSPENGRDDPTARKVWQAARSRAQVAGRSDFRGWHFPHDPDRNYFKGAVFGTPAAFSGAIFHTADFTDARFQCIPYFDGCVFKGPAKFTGTKFGSAAHFKGARFRGEAIFELAYFHQSAFFEGARFREKADFERAVFNTAASFGPTQDTHAIFKGDACFRWVRMVRNAEFRGVEFRGRADFENADFEGSAFFQGARFQREAVFNNTSYKTGRDVVFDGPKADDTPFADRKQGESAYRLAKQAAYARRDLAQADTYRLWEWRARAAREHGLGKVWYKLRAAPRRALIWMARNPWRPLGLGVAIVLFFWAVYCCFDGVCPASASEDEALVYKTKTHEALYFSAVTFTTLGYGDLRPKPFWYWRYLAGAEAVLGALVIAWFVVVLARRLLA